MTDRTSAKPITGSARETAATLLVAGGVVSAFGAASCCALPLLLGSLGFASVWLGSLALVAGPHRPALLAAAVICLVTGGGMLLRRRHASAACARGTICSRPVLSALAMSALCLGAVLAVLGFVFP
jgi:mercuric ion transport protein